MKIQKQMGGIGSGGGRGVGLGGQGGCEWRSEAFVKIQKKNIFLFFLGGGGLGQGGVGLGGLGGWERRIEAFVKIHFFGGVRSGGGSRVGGASCWGLRVDVNGEVKFL